MDSTPSDDSWQSWPAPFLPDIPSSLSVTFDNNDAIDSEVVVETPLDAIQLFLGPETTEISDIFAACDDRASLGVNRTHVRVQEPNILIDEQESERRAEQARRDELLERAQDPPANDTTSAGHVSCGNARRREPSDGRNYLQHLPPHLLAELWPASRVSLGLFVCKWIRYQVMPLINHVQLYTKVGENEIAGRKLSRVRAVCPGLRRLDIPHMGRVLDGRLGAELQKCCALFALTHLSLTDSCFKGNGAKRMSCVGSLPSLTFLSLARSEIGPDAAVSLADGLVACTGLTHLDLHASTVQGASIGSEGGVAVAVALRGLPCLRHLDMAGNLMGPAARSVVLAVKTSGGLVHLDLSGNMMRNRAALAIADAAAGWKGLRRVLLRENPIGKTGPELEQAVQALACCEQLEELDLSSAKLDNAGAAAVAEALPRWIKLRRLALRENRFDSAAAHRLIATATGEPRAVAVRLEIDEL